MPRKLIGITCSTQEAKENTTARQFLNRAYAWAVEQAGGVPVLLPATTVSGAAERYLDALDGLLLSGGVDLAPECYGETPHPALGEVDSDRDALEIPLIRAALAQDMPIFAICRGIQALNVALGGTLYQDLPAQHPTEIEHQQSRNRIPRTDFSHPIRIAAASRLREIVGAEEMQTNSFHHQALREVAPGLTVTAWAPDGVIEAVEGKAQRYLVAVQFHPEETAPNDEKSRRLFEAFVAAL